MSAVSNQYAVALFELALESEVLEEVLKSYAAFLESIDEELAWFFLHPKIAKEDKKSVLKSLDTESLFRDFLSVLIDNNRFKLVHVVYEDMKKLKAAQNQEMQINVYSRSPLSDQKLNDLKAQYAKKYQRVINMVNIIDESIIGGLKFTYNGLVIDDTINQTLSQIKSRLMK